MIVFPRPIKLQDLDDINKNGWFKLSRHFDMLDGETLYRAPKDMLTDGASIPRLCWRLIGSPFTGRYLRGAVIHDAGYKGKLLWGPDEDHLELCDSTREELDILFKKLMLARGVGPWKAWAMYKAVRIGGWVPWRNAREAK